MEAPTIRIFIANDHTIMRNALKTTLQKNSNIKIVGEVGSFTEIFEYLDGNATDILITDDQMPGGSLDKNLPKIKKRWPEIKIFVVPFHREDAKHLVAIKHLVNGILSLNTDDFEPSLRNLVDAT